MEKTGVVIVNYNDSDRIISLVELLLSYNFIDKIIISDNNSSEVEKNKIEKMRSDIVHIVYNNDNIGFSGANNSALTYLKEFNIDYVFTINSDVIVSKEVMKKSIEFLKQHDDIALVSTVMKESGEEKQCFYNFPTIAHAIAENLGIIKLFGIKPKIREQKSDYIICDYIRSSYWCVRYRDFEAIGFFDLNTFLYHVETCVGIKLHRVGKKCALLVNEIYEHNHIYKSGYKMRGYRDTYKSLCYIFKEYYHKNKIQLLLLAISYKLGLLIRWICRVK